MDDLRSVRMGAGMELLPALGDPRKRQLMDLRDPRVATNVGSDILLGWYDREDGWSTREKYEGL